MHLFHKISRLIFVLPSYFFGFIICVLYAENQMNFFLLQQAALVVYHVKMLIYKVIGMEICQEITITNMLLINFRMAMVLLSRKNNINTM